MKKGLGVALSVCMAVAFFSGCSSKSSSLSEDQGGGIGYYVDAAVEGVDYICGKNSGVTDKNGTFKFSANSGCEFKLDKVLLRKVPADELFNGKTVIENNITVARVLQSLDADGNVSNGITIKDDIKKKFSDEINSTVLPSNDAKLAVALQNIDKNLVDESSVIDHLNSSIAKLFRGKTFYMVEEGNDEDINKVEVTDDDNFQFNVSGIQGYFKGKSWSCPTSVETSNGTIDVAGSYTIDIHKDIHSKYILMEDNNKKHNKRLYYKLDDAKKYLQSSEQNEDEGKEEEGK